MHMEEKRVHYFMFSFHYCRVQVIFNVNHSVEFEENVEAEPPADSKDTDTPDGQVNIT